MEGNARLFGRYLHMSGIGMRQGRVHRFFLFIIITTASLGEKAIEEGLLAWPKELSRMAQSFRKYALWREKEPRGLKRRA